MGISEAVRNIIMEKPFIVECVQLNIVNYNALAEYIRPLVENELGSSCKLLSISMALRRYFAELRKNPIFSINIDQNTEITIKSNLMELTLKRSIQLDGKIRLLQNLVQSSDDIMYIIHGTDSVSLLANNGLKLQISEILEKETIEMMKQNIGVIFLSIGEIYRDIPGFFYHITRELAFHQINLLSISNINTQVLLVFYNDDLPRAFQILHNMISRD